MRRTRLGCLTGTGIFAALITAFAIAGYAYASGGMMFSPGSLNADHGQVLGEVSSHAEIAGNCGSCHSVPWESGTMDDRCVLCHANITAQMGDVLTEHGRMYAIDPMATCRDCHPEHNGPEALLTVLDGWKYPHELSGYMLTAHLFKAEDDPFKCADCHAADVTVFDINICLTCHSQRDAAFMTNHVTVYGNACVDCHDGIDSLGQHFTHDQFAFRLMGGHLSVSCEKCHIDAHSLADFKNTAQDCAFCHSADDPHFGVLGVDCVSCHTPANWNTVQFDHNRSAFKLLSGHITVECRKCHLDNAFRGTPMDCFSCHKEDDPHKGVLGQDCERCHLATTWKDVNFDHSTSRFRLVGGHIGVPCATCHKDLLFKGTTPMSCESCHQDVHSGQMGSNCADCHNPGSWKDVHFDHGRTGFPLTGGHSGVACASCHAGGKYRGTPSNCYSCHAGKDKHNGQFGTDCGGCHKPTSWGDVHFDHNNTGFPLTGSHSNVACKSCHANGYKGTPSNCYSCHAGNDRHSGQFGTDCGSCHKPTQWSSVSFNHANTGFPLNGGHSGVQCKACHANGYKGTPTTCYACHASKDPHGGQFGKDCGTCHTTAGWGGAKFDHSMTGFSLSGKHSGLGCTKCHRNGSYGGLSSSCVTCHEDKHNGQNGNDCAQCHTPAGWGK